MAAPMSASLCAGVITVETKEAGMQGSCWGRVLMSDIKMRGVRGRSGVCVRGAWAPT